MRAVRDLRDRQEPFTSGQANIFVRGGSYFFSEPLVLRPEDSDVMLAPYRNEAPILSGGRRIVGWKEVVVDGTHLWATEIPEVGDGKWFFRQLWINGTRAVRARHPNKGYLSIAELPDKTPDWTQGHTRFRFRPGDLQALSTVTNAEAVAMTRWVESRLPVLGVDEKERIVSFSKRSVFELAPGDPYYLEGAFDFLDEPGEWCLEPATGILYYWPRAGERLNEIEAIAPVMAQIVRFEGLAPPQSPAPQFIERVVMRGLTFSHTEWYFPDGFQRAKDKPNVSPEPKAEVGGFAQAAIGVPGSVFGEGMSECAFDRCAFVHLGDYGLEFARGCQRNRVTRCVFSDLGAGGLKIGETIIRGQTAEQTRANEIADCDIRDGGKLFASAEGIWIGQSPDNHIAHNLIHDFYYTGISIGWTWGYGPSLATNNLVEFNHVHHIGVRSDGDGPILSDMGGIYTLGRQPGTRILNNLWHDIAGLRYGGWGIYLDEGSSGILVESNLVYRTTHGGFHQHYGETNILRNNIFAYGRDHQLQRTRPEGHSSFSFRTNIVYFDSGVLLGGDWSGDNFQMDENVYFDARASTEPASFRLGPATWEQWRERGHDRNSIIADPLSVATQRNDFRLQSNSPAFKVGFQPIDLQSVGPR